MLRTIAKILARWKYIYSQEMEAETNLLHAGLSLRLSAEKRALVEKLNKEAEEIEARIKEVSEMEEQGYWLCQNGHEKRGAFSPEADGAARTCLECSQPSQFIKRDDVSGQEKYESDNHPVASTAAIARSGYASLNELLLRSFIAIVRTERKYCDFADRSKTDRRGSRLSTRTQKYLRQENLKR